MMEQEGTIHRTTASVCWDCKKTYFTDEDYCQDCEKKLEVWKLRFERRIT